MLKNGNFSGGPSKLKSNVKLQYNLGSWWVKNRYAKRLLDTLQQQLIAATSNPSGNATKNKQRYFL